jgi:hypothetical protein
VDSTDEVLSPEADQLLDVGHIKNISRNYVVGLVSRLGRKMMEKASLAKQSLQALAASMSLSREDALIHAKAQAQYKDHLQQLSEEVCLYVFKSSYQISSFQKSCIVGRILVATCLSNQRQSNHGPQNRGTDGNRGRKTSLQQAAGTESGP